MHEITIGSPQPSQRVYDQAITVSGRISGRAETIGVWSGDQLLAQTRLIADDGYFRLLARIVPPLQTETPLTLTVRAADVEARVPVIAVPAELDKRAYGQVVPPHQMELLHRENIYGSGPPIEHPSEEALALVRQFLPAAGSVLDFGCGAGAYGPPLIAHGYRWLGVEVQHQCAEILRRRGLPFRQLGSSEERLPFGDREFDAAIAIEVLEHIEPLDATVAEIARVIRSRFLVSVPNMEVIPYFAQLGVVPWHLLEATHVNFFTRASLAALLASHFRAVEVFSYGEHPVRTRDELPVDLHLFAVAEK